MIKSIVITMLHYSKIGSIYEGGDDEKPISCNQQFCLSTTARMRVARHLPSCSPDDTTGYPAARFFAKFHGHWDITARSKRWKNALQDLCSRPRPLCLVASEPFCTPDVNWGRGSRFASVGLTNSGIKQTKINIVHNKGIYSNEFQCP